MGVIWTEDAEADLIENLIIWFKSGQKSLQRMLSKEIGFVSSIDPNKYGPVYELTEIPSV